MIDKHILLTTFLKEPELYFFHTVEWFHIISNSSV